MRAHRCARAFCKDARKHGNSASFWPLNYESIGGRGDERRGCCHFCPFFASFVYTHSDLHQATCILFIQNRSLSCAYELENSRETGPRAKPATALSSGLRGQPCGRARCDNGGSEACGNLPCPTQRHAEPISASPVDPGPRPRLLSAGCQLAPAS